MLALPFLSVNFVIMNKIIKNVNLVQEILKRHERYTNFSGTSVILTGILWLLNEGINQIYDFDFRTRIYSWIGVVLVSVFLAISLTFYERGKVNKEKVTLSLMALVDKLIVISIGTLTLIYVFFIYGMYMQIPALLLLMYGTLILTSKRNISNIIKYFGYANLLTGVLAFAYPAYSLYLTWLILGLGHIILGIALLFIKDK